jgi:predicted NACHT family NTPase
MARSGYGPQAKKKARHLLEILLSYANDELEDCGHLKIEFSWKSETNLIIKTTVRQLEALTDRALHAAEGNRVFPDSKLTSEQIKEALKRYKDFLAILEDHRTKTQGADVWHFTLKLWFGRQEKASNLRCFDEEWERRRPEKSRQMAAENAEFLREETVLDEDAEVDGLVQSVRKQASASIQARCGTMRVLDMSQPIRLDSIYTTANIYESLSGLQRRGFADLQQQLSTQYFTHLGRIEDSRISGLAAVEKYSKLMIFGKPGAGKTAFLKWLAIQCNEGHRWTDLIPVFITVKDFAEAKGQPELLSYIQKQWADCGVWDKQPERLLQKGRALILLDGLDEVKEADHSRVLREICDFSAQFHTCLFVISCRVAAREYVFEQFTEVEMADFDDQQITNFVTQWFNTKNETVKIAECLKSLHENHRILELATNPLLLTMLCLVFQEVADFPTNRAELYREALEIMLRKWDAKRNIERGGLPQRSDLYQKLSLGCKEALLQQIAFTTFERGDYFFKQQAVEQYIANFLLTLTTIHDEPEHLEIDNEAILKSIEAQHGLLVERARGIYSFSHLTFHEYFTAKKIASKPETQLAEALQALACNVTNRDWREVFLLTVNMLTSADSLLLMMKSQIDEIPSFDTKLQHFLTWLNEKASSASSSYRLAVVRSHASFLVTNRPSAISLTRAMTSDEPAGSFSRANAFDDHSDFSARTKAISIDVSSIIANISNTLCAVTVAMEIAIIMNDNIFNAHVISNASAILRNILGAIDRAIALASSPELQQELQFIKNQLPDLKENPSVFKQWWKDNGLTWTEQLRDVQIQYRDLVYDWQFSESQLALLDKYYRANALLVDCLNSGCCVSKTIRDEIDETLLLSIKDIEQYKKAHQQREMTPIR